MVVTAAKRIVMQPGLVLILLQLISFIVESRKFDGNPKLSDDLKSTYTSESIHETSEKDVLVEVISAIDDTDSLRAWLEAHGARVTACTSRVCSSYCPVDKLDCITESEQVRFISRSVYERRTGSVTSEGDAAMLTDVLRQTFGLDGTGVTVCTLSDSYNCLGGAPGDVASDDLPEGVVVLKDYVRNDCIDEGRAMMQHIHDVAPGCNQIFRTANEGAADFAVGIGELVDAGCDIIVEDIGYLTEPFFQDGQIAQAANAAVERGVPFFSAAGNSGRNAWETTNGFVDAGRYEVLNFPYNLHSFGNDENGDPIITLRLVLNPISTQLSFWMQWDEPSSFVPGSTGCTNDLDLFFFVNNQPLASTSVNTDTGVPIESVSFVPANFGTGLIVIDMLIGLFEGSPPGKIKVWVNEDVGFPTNAPTSFGHPNAALVAAVGAADYLETPAFGVTPPRIEDFSSAGGTPILLAADGSRLASPEIRNQPRFVGPNGGITTFFGRFFGTSAAAPHVAALAALLLQANSLSPSELYSVLQDTAVDMDDPATDDFDVGFDFGTGYGLVNAVAAIEQVFVQPSSIPSSQPASAPTAAPTSSPSVAPVPRPTRPPTPKPSPRPTPMPIPLPTSLPTPSFGTSCNAFCFGGLLAAQAGVSFRRFGDLGCSEVCVVRFRLLYTLLGWDCGVCPS